MAADMRDRIIEALEYEAPSHGIDIVDVEIAGASKAPVVRVRIDHADESLPTITLEEVSQENRWIDACIEAVDPFPGSYTLEVSSPGLARPLRRLRDFERFAGEEVQLQTTAHEGRKRFTGELSGVSEGKVVLVCEDGEHSFDLDEIRSCKIKPVIDFSRSADAER